MGKLSVGNQLIGATEYDDLVALVAGAVGAAITALCWWSIRSELHYLLREISHAIGGKFQSC